MRYHPETVAHVAAVLLSGHGPDTGHAHVKKAVSKARMILDEAHEAEVEAAKAEAAAEAEAAAKAAEPEEPQPGPDETDAKVETDGEADTDE